jgi:hypothetical protein
MFSTSGLVYPHFGIVFVMLIAVHTKRKSRMEPGMNPLASKNSNSISSSNGGGKLGSKQASGRRMSKKKSLKRL